MNINYNLYSKLFLKVSFVFLIVLSIFSRIYFNDIPFYYGKRLYFYYALINVVIFGLLFSFNFEKFSFRRMLFLLSFILLQIGVLTLQLFYVDEQTVFKKIFSFLFFSWNIVFIHFFIIVQYVNKLGKNQAYNLFSKSIMIIFFIVITSNILQLTALLHIDMFDHLVTLFGKTLEVQWPNFTDSSMVHPFYQIDDSYVKTQHRLNGMAEEASENVGMIFVTFLPLFFSRMIRKFKFNQSSFPVEILYIVLSLIILLIAKASTGFLFAIITFIIFLSILIKYKKQIAFLILAVTVISILTYILYTHESITDSSMYYVTKVINWQENVSTNSRLAITYSLLLVFINNPIFGVGRGMINEHIAEYLPSWSYWNPEIIEWNSIHTYPVLSEIGGLLAEYGLVGVSFIFFFFWYVYKKLKLSFIKHSTDQSSMEIFLSFKFFMFFLFLAMLSHIVWYKSLFILITAFYYAIAINYQRKKYNDFNNNSNLSCTKLSTNSFRKY